jgi:hypothetical protein
LTIACRSIGVVERLPQQRVQQFPVAGVLLRVALMMKSSKVVLGVERTTKPAALSVATEVGGTGPRRRRAGGS